MPPNVESGVVEAAWLYYNDGLTQSQIARELKLSRATVVGYLKRARKLGYVRTVLADDVFTTSRLSRELREAFGLQASLVVSERNAGAGTVERVMRAAASWLPGLLEPGDRLGVSWCKTTYAVASAYDGGPMDRLTVVQLLGALATTEGFTSETCSTLLAGRLGAPHRALHCPAVISDPCLAKRLRAEPTIAAQLSDIASCNKALFSVGTMNAGSLVVASGLATLDELDAYRAAGAVGTVCARFVDAEGAHVPGPLDDRIMGIELDWLAKLETSLLVAVGTDKAAQMRAAIVGGLVTHLATSRTTAEALLDLA
ncbi:MAG: sugar-binding domain-containing protein [Pseudomonadota bacterium]